MQYFRWAIAVTVLGLVGAFALGWSYGGGLKSALSFLFVGAVLAVLEISLSFDNAIVNANKLKTMSEKWQKRFLTWGILIAVFGMRIVFPVAVVCIAAGIGPISAITLAATDQHEYAEIMHGAHYPIVAFGGTFLFMVALGFFLDDEKEVDWIRPVERPMRRLSRHGWAPIALALCAILAMTALLSSHHRWMFVTSCLAGLATFVFVDIVGRWLDKWSSAETSRGTVASGGLGAFLYLEMLDASFSFDGVIGAFALTQNLFLIAIGLGIGAMFVRSMTLMIVERKTLASFRYLEHGAFWSILALSFAMYLQIFMPVPEVITGLIGAVLIGVSLVSSIRFNRSMRIAQD